MILNSNSSFSSQNCYFAFRSFNKNLLIQNLNSKKFLQYSRFDKQTLISLTLISPPISLRAYWLLKFILWRRKFSFSYITTKNYEVVANFSLWYVCRTFLYIKPASRFQFSFLARLVLEEFARRFDLPDCKPVRNRIVNCRNQRKENLKIKRKEMNINI